MAGELYASPIWTSHTIFGWSFAQVFSRWVSGEWASFVGPSTRGQSLVFASAAGGFGAAWKVSRSSASCAEQKLRVRRSRNRIDELCMGCYASYSHEERHSHPRCGHRPCSEFLCSWPGRQPDDVQTQEGKHRFFLVEHHVCAADGLALKASAKPGAGV